MRARRGYGDVDEAFAAEAGRALRPLDFRDLERDGSKRSKARKRMEGTM